MSNGLEFNKALTAMMTTLRTYLPAPAAQVPNPSLGIASLAERTVGVGNWRGTRSGVAPVSLQGGRIDALVRFQLWAQEPGDVIQAVQTLSTKLLGDRDKLRGSGFLRLAMQSAAEPDPLPDLTLWRQSADFHVLFEYGYDSSDGQGLIARIPVAIDSGLNDGVTITDEMARWDDAAAEPLIVRGRTSVGRITVVDNVGGTSPTGTVTLLRTRDDTSGPPTAHPTLNAFLAAVSDDTPAEQHSQFTFVSWNAFVAALHPDAEPLVLGADTYTMRDLEIEPAIRLPGPFDRFEIRYETAPFNHPATAYLRTRPG